jgi:lipid II:glycine glycyltransferase (peptidoglycan interpeptide bridge formation enzyme)
MNIVTLDAKDEALWNAFITKNFPPVGAFLQSWEWGTFKKILHGELKRFAIVEKGEWIGCFQMEIHAMPLGMAYGYAPRGPVLRKDLWDNKKKATEVFECIIAYLKSDFPKLIFVRLEPPHKNRLEIYDKAPCTRLTHYLQPRFNQLISLASAEAMQKTFSTDIRHDIRAAERLGVSVESKEELSPKEQHAFEAMKTDTRNRSNRNIFPSDAYFTNFLNSFTTAPTGKLPQPYLRFFIASKEGEPVAIHLNLFFADTLTYLYGASYSGSVSKRAPAYLHWKSMRMAEEAGYHYYDLGGVDDAFWHGLTYFKRQFGGETYEYAGTFDVVIQPVLYSVYKGAKKISGYIKKIVVVK